MKDKLIALLKTLGLLKDEDVAKVTAELDKLDLDKKPEPPAPVDTSKITDPILKQLIEKLEGRNNSLEQMVKDLTTKLAAEAEAREKAINAQQAADKMAAEKKVTDAVEVAIKSGKYPEAKRAWLKERFEKDFEGFSDIVKESPVDKHFKAPAEPKHDKDGKPIIDVPVYKGPLSGADRTILGKITEMNDAN